MMNINGEILLEDSFFDYCEKNNLGIVSTNDGEEYIQLRALGIQCAEIPHYSPMAIKKTDIINASIDELGTYKVIYKKYDKNGNVTSLSEHRDFYVIRKASDNNEIEQYREIIKSLPKDENIKEGYENYLIVSTDESTQSTIKDAYADQKKAYDLLKKAEKIRIKIDLNGAYSKKTSSLILFSNSSFDTKK